MMKIIFAILSVATIFISPDCGSSHDIVVKDSWAVADKATNPDLPDAPPTDIANIYLTITNNTKEVDTLVSMMTQAADTAQIVETVIKEGVPQPQVLASLDIKPDHDVMLKPRKVYIRLTNLKQPLIEGASFQLTLVFKNAGEIKQSVLVEKQGSTKFEN